MAVRRAAGVAPKVNLKNSMQAGDEEDEHVSQGSTLAFRPRKDPLPEFPKKIRLPFFMNTQMTSWT